MDSTNIKINKDLNKCFEILGLIYISRHPEYISKEQIQKSASEFYSDLDELYSKFSPVLKKYLSVFQKYMVEKKENDFDLFEEEDNYFIITLQMVCANNIHWLEDMEDISEDAIVAEFLKIIAEDQIIKEKPALNDLVQLLKNQDFSPSVCWKLMLMLQEPKKQMMRVTKIINDNIPAYEHAITSIEKPLRRLIEDFPKASYKITSIMPINEITPILIYPVLEIMDITGKGYAGLFVKEFNKFLDRSKSSSEKLLPALKALCDTSKYEILISLKHSPKYNLELAEQLGLSAATVSHHMNVLLTHNLVSVEKRDGRVYYTLIKETIEEVIHQLQNNLIK